MTARQLLDGIDVIEKQLALFRISAHADRAAIDASGDVLVELAALVRDTKADELGDDSDGETVTLTPEMVGAFQIKGGVVVPVDLEADTPELVDDPETGSTP